MGTARILVVDDERDYNETIVKRLARRGFLPQSAFSGQQALEALGRDPFDVVLLDILMPGMDGIETLREIKKRFPGPEVILLTGHASVESGVQGMSIGANAYLLKPVDFEELLAAIDQAHERKLLGADTR
ncbi:Transcriptional regulatory protein ZraR [Fundidesulfovibrio magnetotacticus]|uniref:Transcriptional regulatory protein ZraR n=1 Tax=Fundidesulfovibrio magnetotacticus TaxID=2730080 RepID=A0A6V8M0T2_9BACT|nr:response regulator [Fundidesulfovibrio magnetotacticus]GFK94075.1 Transcriptional regulatory protein ZraR [Fundidesulfovibrio magnetotacticus]